jgi:uncharacterized LabA/DUF88 family protein
VSKNVAVFVDVANIFYAAKAAGADIDYVTLLKAAVAGRDFVRAYAYTGLDPENENQRNFHSFLARHGYKVVSKDIRKYGDGKVKANLDIELVVDMMKTARNLDVAIVVSGDGDFAPAIRAVQEMGVRVEVISFRGNTSSDLIEVADAFYDITQVARVEHESSRSGRRVAGDDEDLSMTEVPDKQTEGRGGGRGRGRGGRGRGGRSDAIEETVVAAPRAERPAGRVAAGGTAPRTGGRLVALPGEKLSRAGAGGEMPADEELDETIVEVPETMVEDESLDAEAGVGGEAGDATGRRRRRRGGRGRGHGRSAETTAEDGEDQGAEAIGDDSSAEQLPEAEVRATRTAAPRPVKSNQFGSVWDSQIGMADRPPRADRVAPVAADDDDFAEPEIPEYLLAERRRGGNQNRGGRGGGGGGGRGVRSAYASAVERERYGRSASPAPSSSVSRYSEPNRQGGGQPPRRRDERPQRQPVPQPQRGGGMPRSGRDSSEPWSEVPPELEELLRAQLSTKLTRPASPRRDAPAEAVETMIETMVEGDDAAPQAASRPAPRGRRKAAAADAAPTEVPTNAAPAEVAAEVPTKVATKPTAKVRAKATAPAVPVAEAAEVPEAKKRAPARRKPAEGTAALATEAAAEATPPAQAADAPAPKKRAPARRKPAAAEQSGDAPETPAGD